MAQVILRLLALFVWIVVASGGLVFWFFPTPSEWQVGLGTLLFFVAVLNLIALTVRAAFDIRKGFRPVRGENDPPKGTAHAPRESTP